VLYVDNNVKTHRGQERSNAQRLETLKLHDFFVSNQWCVLKAALNVLL